MTIKDARTEIMYRLERETRLILLYASLPDTSHDIRAFINAKLKDNDLTISLIGKYLETQYGDTWEKFYRENYWEMRK